MRWSDGQEGLTVSQAKAQDLGLTLRARMRGLALILQAGGGPAKVAEDLRDVADDALHALADLVDVPTWQLFPRTGDNVQLPAGGAPGPARIGAELPDDGSPKQTLFDTEGASDGA